jgi:acyl carrier protein
MTDTGDRIRKIIAEHFARMARMAQSAPFDRARVTDDADLVDDLGGDSLDRVEIVMDIEDQFEREFPEDQVERLKTVGDFVALI